MIVKHDDDTTFDHAQAYFQKNGFHVDIRHPFKGEAIGEVTDDLAGTIIYGGRLEADDLENYPFFHEEYDWIEQCLNADIPMLGICLGAQMIACHLGGSFYEKASEVTEFGCYPITPTKAGEYLFPSPFYVIQGHQDSYDIPDSCTNLAESKLFKNQAFQYGDKVYGFQFHPEQTV